MNRLPINKTPKVYVGGAFIRSESGRVFPVLRADGKLAGQVPQCTRKDVRNAVEAAAKAGPGWARRTPYNRGQILYRLAEMMETRASELAESIALGGDASTAGAEVDAAIDRVVYYAGWADKYEQVLGNVNPVAGPFFNFSVTEPMGIVGLIAPPTPPLLGLISVVAPVIVSGNTTVTVLSESAPLPGIVLGEMLATSDLPAGVVNLLSGFHAEMLPTFGTHEHVRALAGVVSEEERRTLETGAAESIKRCHLRVAADENEWFSPTAQSVYAIRDFVEVKTVWHPVGA